MAPGSPFPASLVFLVYTLSRSFAPNLTARQCRFLLLDHTLSSEIEIDNDLGRNSGVVGDVALLGPLAQFLGRLLLVCQELADEPHQAGIDLVDWRAALVLSDQQPASTAWHLGHVCCAFAHQLRDSGAQRRPPVLQSLDAGIAAGDLQHDRAGG